MRGAVDWIALEPDTRVTALQVIEFCEILNLAVVVPDEAIAGRAVDRHPDGFPFAEDFMQKTCGGSVMAGELATEFEIFGVYSIR